MNREELTPEEWGERLRYWQEEKWVAERHLAVADEQIAVCYQHLGQLALDFAD